MGFPKAFLAVDEKLRLPEGRKEIEQLDQPCSEVSETLPACSFRGVLTRLFVPALVEL